MLLQVQRLPDTSLTAALMSGGRDHFGWGVDRYLAASTYDALNTNTAATGSWKKGKAPKFPPFPRPSTKPKTTADGAKKKTTVRELFQKFTSRNG